MARSRLLRRVLLTMSNVCLPIAALVFASGFFPYKPFLPGLATFQDVQEAESQNVEQPEAVFDRVVFMVVDALRSDFVYGHGSGFEFTQSLIRSGVAVPFTAHATPPTVTMPRVKALTTGSVPSFLDLILNFAESDTTSSLATQDTWLAQIKAKGGKLVFYGDDTWLKLFPGDFFARSDGTSSFFVSVSRPGPGLLIEHVAEYIISILQDFTEVDNNVTRHVPDELARDDWNAMIMHYLGLDHIGHKTGPQGPNMLPKQREMDGIVKEIYEAMESYAHHSSTLLVLAGDHGMNAGGNHGGSGPGETEPALLFASPKFKDMKKRREYRCPTLPKDRTEFHYYSKIEQSDVVPTLAGLMGMPVSKNSLGVFPMDLGGLWNEAKIFQLLQQNARQLLHIVRAKYGAEDEQRFVSEWHQILDYVRVDPERTNSNLPLEGLYAALLDAQEDLSDTASSYDIPRMVVGMSVMVVALMLAIISFPSLWPPSSASLFFALISVLYGVMMFASSYVEEEQHFWYWLTPAWIVLLALNKSSTDASRIRTAIAAAVLLCTHRVATRWNQTGQKHAGDPDIVHTIFPEHHVLMWILVLATYMVNGFFLHNRTFAGLLIPELKAFADVTLDFLAIVFKLNFTQADAPELVQGLALRLREWSEPFSLVTQARAVFAVISAMGVVVVVLSIGRARTRVVSETNDGDDKILLCERLHHLLTLFLMTQTRAPNVPLFLVLELQRLSLSWLLSVEPSEAREGPTETHPQSTAVATSILLLSHVTYFCMSGSNSISSIDLSNAYNGVADYNIAAVGVLLFGSNWAGPIWLCSAAVLLLTSKPSEPAPKQTTKPGGERDWVMVEREKLHKEAVTAVKPDDRAKSTGGSQAEPWFVYIASMTAFIACALLAVMAACTALRTHLFIWTVFSPKYLYALAWCLGWHLIVNIGVGSLLYKLGRIT